MHAQHQMLEDCTLAMAAQCWPMGYDVSNVAPDTYAALRRINIATGTVLVWNGASEDTIYSCPAVNYAARAWHDWCHLRGDYDFSMDGEAATCRMQVNMLSTWCEARGIDAFERQLAANLLDADINGQGAWKRRWGTDVVRQREFDVHYIVSRSGALAVKSYGWRQA